jgi:predicted component of type VI protein secretion system
MTPELKSRIEDEVGRFASDLNLSDIQRAQLRAAFESAEAKLDQNASPHGVRDTVREHVTKILNSQQLAKWDSAIAKAKTLLGHTLKP